MHFHALVRSAFVVLLAASTAAVAATEVANGYKCATGASPEKLIRTFIDRRVISAQAYEVVDAIHAFAARQGFTAFGFPLVAVIGWQENSELFGRGPGTAPPVHFSFVVQSSAWQLSNAVRKQGVKLTPDKAADSYPQVRVNGFNSETSDTIPPGADPRFVYAQVVCSPRI